MKEPFKKRIGKKRHRAEGERHRRLMAPIREKTREKPFFDIPFEDISGVRMMLALTREYLFLSRDTGERAEVTAYPVAQIEKARFMQYVGGGAIELTVSDKTFELCRFDMKSAQRLSQAVVALNSLRENAQNPDFVPDFKPRGALCAKCGRPLPPHSNFCPKCTSKSSSIKRLWKYAKPDAARIIFAVVLYFVISAVRLAIPLLQRHMVDGYITAKTLPQNAVTGLVTVVAAIALTQLITNLFEILRANTMAGVSRNLIKRLHLSVYEKIQSLSIESISKKTSGDLIQRVSGDCDNISRFLSHSVAQIIESAILVIAAGALMVAINPLLALIIIIPAPVVVMVFRKVMHFTHRLYHNQWKLDSESGTRLYDVFQGIRVVKVFGMEDSEIKKYNTVIKKLAVVSEKNEVIWSLVMPYANYLLSVGNFVMLLFVGSRILDGQMTLGDMTLFSSLVGMLYGALQSITQMPRMLQRMTTSSAKIFEILDEEEQIKESPSAAEIKLEGKVELSDVWFGYEENRDVLKGVSLTIEPGEMVGIVGRSGVGKSTLINLIMRLYDPRRGSVKLDGVDIKDIKEPRAQMGVVLQETFLFGGSIYNNIAYARPDADRADIIRAAKLGGAHDFIMKLPDGYNTVVGEKGHTLSGGERQRIAISRAILRDPRILILDEATASLDTETEQKIQDSIAYLIKDRTTIAIAHRLSTLRHASKIIVLDKGKVAETGSHSELMAAGGIYYGLVMAQRDITKMKS